MIMPSFKVGIAAQGDSFYGRTQELETVLAHRWAWICAQRRMGKSSLMLRVGKEAQQRGWLPFYLTLDVIRKERACGEEIFRTFYRRHYRRTLKARGFEPGQFDDFSPEDAFGELVEQLVENNQDVVFLWDEAERLIDVDQQDPDFLKALGARLRNIEKFGLVIAGTQRLTELFPEEAKVSSFMSFFKWVPLKGLDDADARRLLQCEQTGGWPSPLALALVHESVDWCGGHPHILQELGSGLALATEGDGRKATDSTLTKCCQTILVNEIFREIFKDDQRRLTPPQQAVLRLVCKVTEKLTVDSIASSVGYPPPQVEAAIGFLANFGYLQWNGHVALRFRFYPGFLLESQGDSVTDQHKVERLKPTLFVSYCHADTSHFERLMMFLRPLLRTSNTVCFWSDREIEPGERWDDAVKQALERAHIGLLLITQDFLASEYISGVEVPSLLEKAQKDSLRLLCLYVSPSNVQQVRYRVGEQDIRLTAYQGLNTPGDPLLSHLNVSEQDAMLAQVSVEIAHHLEGVQSGTRS